MSLGHKEVPFLLESSKMEATALKQVIIVLVIVIAFAVLLGTAPYVAGQQKATAPSIDTYQSSET